MNLQMTGNRKHIAKKYEMAMKRLAGTNCKTRIVIFVSQLLELLVDGKFRMWSLALAMFKDRGLFKEVRVSGLGLGKV